MGDDRPGAVRLLVTGHDGVGRSTVAALFIAGVHQSGLPR
jgi:hypothetical protein